MPNEGEHGNRYSLPSRFASCYGKGEDFFGSRYRDLKTGLEGRNGEQNVSEARPLNPAYLINGPFVGKAPKNYNPLDLRIAEELNERLTWHGEIDPSDVEVFVRARDVSLKGRVPDLRTKDFIERLAASIPGVKHVHSRLKKRPPRMGEKDYHNIAS